MFAVDARGPLTYRTARTHFARRAAGGTDGRSAARPAAHGHDERGGGGCRHPRAARPAGSQDYGDGGPVRAGGWLASRGRTARNRRRDGGGDGRRRGSGLTLAWHAVGILAFGPQPEASKCSTTTSCISPVIRRCWCWAALQLSRIGGVRVAGRRSSSSARESPTAARTSTRGWPLKPSDRPTARKRGPDPDPPVPDPHPARPRVHPPRRLALPRRRHGTSGQDRWQRPWPGTR